MGKANPIPMHIFDTYAALSQFHRTQNRITEWCFNTNSPEIFGKIDTQKQTYYYSLNFSNRPLDWTVDIIFDCMGLRPGPQWVAYSAPQILAGGEELTAPFSRTSPRLSRRASAVAVSSPPRINPSYGLDRTSRSTPFASL